MKRIGIRDEDKYAMERRSALTPKHAQALIEKHGIQIDVLSSKKRAFTDKEFLEKGCNIVDNLDDNRIIFGIKEIPIDKIASDKTYIIFSHVIKGQAHNMPMLKKFMKKKCNLIDYECIVDDNNKRLIFFGHYAGLAGTINTLWAFGLRTAHLGITTPFKKLRQTHTYFSLDEALETIKEIGKDITTNGLPKELLPLTIGITGYGNVSKGAQEILKHLPVIEITPEELLELKQKATYSDKHIYKIVFYEKHIAKHKKGTAFDLNEFFTQPANFISNFNQYTPHLSILLNCMYWDDRYDRLITKDYLADLYSNKNLRLHVIGDITCDPNGSIEFTHMGTEINDPIFVYHPITRQPTFGHKGEGVVVMAVDILPSELPRDSSNAFADALTPFVNDIASCDFSADYENLSLPAPIKKALILHNGKLTPKYAYIQAHLDKFSE